MKRRSVLGLSLLGLTLPAVAKAAPIINPSGLLQTFEGTWKDNNILRKIKIRGTVETRPEKYKSWNLTRYIYTFKGRKQDFVIRSFRPYTDQMVINSLKEQVRLRRHLHEVQEDLQADHLEALHMTKRVSISDFMLSLMDYEIESTFDGKVFIDNGSWAEKKLNEFPNTTVL